MRARRATIRRVVQRRVLRAQRSRTPPWRARTAVRLVRNPAANLQVSQAGSQVVNRQANLLRSLLDKQVGNQRVSHLRKLCLVVLEVM